MGPEKLFEKGAKMENTGLNWATQRFQGIFRTLLLRFQKPKWGPVLRFQSSKWGVTFTFSKSKMGPGFEFEISEMGPEKFFEK